MPNNSKKHRNIYAKTLAGKAIDTLQNTSLNKKAGVTVDIITNEASIEIDGIKITVGNYDRVAMNVGARKLLDMVLWKLSEQLPYREATAENLLRARTITIPLAEYMGVFGLKDKKNAAEQFEAASMALMNISLKFDYEKWEKPKTPKGRRKKVKKHFSYYLFEGATETRNFEDEILVNACREFKVGISIIEYLTDRRIRPVNLNMFTINPHKNPHSYNMGRKLTDYYNLNAKEAGQFVRLSVKSLIACCPELPKPEDVNERHYAQLIMKPVQRDLDAVADVYGIADWHYCHRGGEPLTDYELANYDFKDWLDFLIEYTLPEYPIKQRQIAALN